MLDARIRSVSENASSPGAAPRSASCGTSASGALNNALSGISAFLQNRFCPQLTYEHVMPFNTYPNPLFQIICSIVALPAKFIPSDSYVRVSLSFAIYFPFPPRHYHLTALHLLNAHLFYCVLKGSHS